MQPKFISAFKSFAALPKWVQVWILAILAPVNVAPLFIMETPTGWYGTLAVALVVVCNTPLVFLNGGFSKVLAIPHIFAWLPLSIYIIYRAFFGDGYIPGSSEALLAAALLVVNSISLGFDFFDTGEWLGGNRGITGYPERKPVL